jgi:ActD protein
MNSENDIVVLCSEADLAKQSVNALISAGISTGDIVLMSSEPLEQYGIPFHERTFMPWLVVCGAIVGGIGGFLLASLTQKSYAIHTGGMQVVTLWTDGIITYELTMLGAIVTTGVVFLLTGVLLGRDQFPYEPEVSEGKVLVGVASVPASMRNKIIESLKAFGEVRERQRGLPDLRG